METYETARIAIVDIEEDVIAASPTGCSVEDKDCGSIFTIYFSDGSSKRINEIEEGLPEEYWKYCL